MKSLIFGFFFLFLFGISTQSCLQYLSHRSIDGSCNNILFPSRGKSGELFGVGAEGSKYYPQVHIPRIEPLPTYAEIDMLPDEEINGNTRRISNLLSAPYDESIVDSRGKNLFSVYFAQFIGHDLENNRFVNPGDAGFQGTFVEYVKERDDVLCTLDGVYRCNDNNTILTTNGQQSDGKILSDGTFRAINNATSFLDLHVVYGVNDEIANKVRSKVGGKLIMNKKRTFNITMLDGDTIEYTLENFLPLYDELPLPLDRLFTIFGGTHLAVVGGEHRINVNIGVGALHTLFLREHNRVCDELMNKNILWKLFPTIFDEIIYQKARHIVIAKYQKIVYEQYLLSLLGHNKYSELGEYHGYNILADPSIHSAFAAGAFRYGHYALKPSPALDECDRVYKHGKPTNDVDHRPIELGANNPTPDAMTHIGRVIEHGSYENAIRGMIAESQMAMNLSMHHTLRSLANSRGGFDLAALDIMRSRMNGVPEYLKLRRLYNKLRDPLTNNIYGNNDCPLHLEEDEDINDPLECFLYITKNVEKASKIKEAYGKIIYVDGLVGMLLEDHDNTTSIGETAANVIIDQFKRLRDGDRFYYEELLDKHYFTKWEKDEIMETTMGKLLRRNFDGDEVDFPDNPFITPDNYRQNLKDRCNLQ